jgi:hypothetical protein
MRSFLLFISIVTTTLASADIPGKNWLTQVQVTKKLAGLGFKRVIKLEADDGHWEGDAMKGRRIYEIHVDPNSGALIKFELKD